MPMPVYIQKTTYRKLLCSYRRHNVLWYHLSDPPLVHKHVIAKSERSAFSSLSLKVSIRKQSMYYYHCSHNCWCIWVTELTVEIRKSLVSLIHPCVSVTLWIALIYLNPYHCNWISPLVIRLLVFLVFGVSKQLQELYLQSLGWTTTAACGRESQDWW